MIDMKNKLFALMTECTDLQSYVEASAKLLACPYWIMDAGFSLIAISHQPDALTIYDRFLKHTSVMDSLERWKEKGVLAEENHRVPMVFHDELLGCDVMILDIFVKDTGIGRMTVILANAVSEEDVMEVAQGASIYLRNSLNDHNRDTYHQAFASLLRREDVEMCAKVLVDSPLLLEPPYQVVCVGSYSRDVLFAYAKYMNDYDEGLIPVVTGGYLYALVSKKHPFRSLEKIQGYQSSFVFENLEDLSSYGIQARFAYEQKEKIEDCYVRFVGNILTKQVSLTSLVLPEVKACVKYDEMYHTAYFDTLCMYMECGFSKQETAKRMNVHLNTIKYRLAQMQELFHIPFQTKRSELVMACQMQKIL